ncbi:hypothetical protein SASPL_131754 [Salvia splendens]|uniref:BPL/LPL catalytic domain-containing protein n=1 Tax=Salvia splendens TaxID=180675 RepID=A0A8X8ZL97_SALSN|nr:hypothetical protein SASPL_131754 [Salvia splendens]
MILTLSQNLSSTPHLSAQTSSKLAPIHHRCCAIHSLSLSPRRSRCDFYDLHNELVPYAEAWRWQKSIVEEKKALNEKDEDISESLIILQHQPVYTLGAGSSDEFLKFDLNDAPFDLYRTERGGEVTYHGPGQDVVEMNVGYDNEMHMLMKVLVSDYLLLCCALASHVPYYESTASQDGSSLVPEGTRRGGYICAISSAFDIEASRVAGLTGVWVGMPCNRF